MKLRSLSLPLAILFAQVTFATSAHHQVEACPSLAAIKAVGIHMALHDSTWGWFGLNTNQYDTSEKWTFAFLLGGEPQDEAEAIEKANADLPLLTQVTGPERGSQNGEESWACAYTGNDNEMALAVTPPFTQDFASIISRYRR